MGRWLILLIAALGLGLAGTSLAGEAGTSALHEANACAPGYLPCLPVAADIDCDQISDAKKPVRVTGADPYGLDRDRDGLGCEIAGEGGGRQSSWGVILRKPPRKEATSATVGDTLTVVGWSPRSFRGENFQLCVTRANGSACEDSNRYVLRGTVQTFGTWRVARGDGRRGLFKLSLQAKGKIRAFDTVPLR